MAIKVDLTEMRYCPMCGFEQPTTEFYKSVNPRQNGFLPYCKQHCADICRENISKTKSLAKGLYCSCGAMDIPFVKQVYDKFTEQKEQKKQDGTLTLQKYKEYNNFYYYYNQLQAMMPRKKGVKSPWIDFSDTNVCWTELQGGVVPEETIVSEKDALIQKWGRQDTIEDYQFLEAKYNEYIKDIDIENPQQKDLYRDLVLDRLLLQKIRDGRYEGNDDITKVQSRISKLMSTLKVDQFESHKAKTTSELSLMARISAIDENNVKDIYSNPNKELTENKLRNYYKDLVLRPLLNTLVGKRDFNINLEDIEQYNMPRENPLLGSGE